MSDLKKIKSALISVYHKDKLDGIIKKLDQLGVQLYSTGGTQTFIEGLGVNVIAVEQLTSYPSILGGRVKTLHPKVFGGILTRRDNAGDQQQIVQYEIPEIDLVIVDLYPFEETVASGAGEQDIIEKIDIGGISLIRAAAKNFNDVLIVSSRTQYEKVISLLNEKQGETSIEDRKEFARDAFATSSHYDSAIFNYFNEGPSAEARVSLNDGQVLRYGENPHQSATFFKFDNSETQVTLANAEVLQGKALSYNNLLDADAAWKSCSDAYHSVSHIQDKVAVSVVKHLNPCGLAVTDTIMKSLELAWAGDPVSAYGGIICFTDVVTAEIAAWFSNRFVEIIIAPEFTPEALEILGKKKNLRLLVTPVKPQITREKLYRSISGGMLVQDEDEGLETDFKNVTKIQFSNNKMNLAKFGITACKHLKSNAIALVTENADGSFWLTGAGMGQPNRLDSLRHLTIPRFNLKEGIEMKEAVLISDAFFPFRDSIEAANEYGVKYIVEPGGSIRDEEVIEACDEFGIAMLFTGMRHFKH
ncbi:MAG: bifunctional phosphoribosylaminoimidazolecarboxamide formyltransferase/IMP cyclohydrolase [Bacteroidetes bacterium GWF2_42_66]|nr:MAG: bifunctional phosphoribosylaminoimidazolecarboxamide formyltransferase/IMP cyclohydrolase [Bacteroidetes bacterium GWA2_42_15]OFY03563.1 MAG: bifunctional phosphoribosylaminoimidazolecarboxamide formyltransferase/IMP cyclohydrolase [Bacteroidetes bacterium GWE2_42_39]OFY45928.1 MAG: bifunctional phosphoribosylaminoimidazolecarboxamide formyltransferase/IMP cyclohydrolase [Bacteroidetes bacterium GWF2_42_66]HBL75170.1 bifunctional phosphoribosylaminoimidazolecarboxamide formyltransferase/